MNLLQTGSDDTEIPVKPGWCASGLIQSIIYSRKNALTHLLQTPRFETNTKLEALPAHMWVLLLLWRLKLGFCMNDHCGLSRQILFIGKYLIPCERQRAGWRASKQEVQICKKNKNKKTEKQPPSVGRTHFPANSSHTRCCVGKDAACRAVRNSAWLAEKHFFFFLFSAFTTSASLLPLQVVCQSLTRWKSVSDIISRHQFKVHVLPLWEGWGCPLCSTGNHEFPLLNREKATAHVYFILFYFQTTQDRILYLHLLLPTDTTSTLTPLLSSNHSFSCLRHESGVSCTSQSEGFTETSARTHARTYITKIFMWTDEGRQISSGSALSFGDTDRLPEFKRSVGGLKVASLKETVTDLITDN